MTTEETSSQEKSADSNRIDLLTATGETAHSYRRNCSQLQEKPAHSYRRNLLTTIGETAHSNRRNLTTGKTYSQQQEKLLTATGVT